jgi:hypothetical protein
MRSVIAVMCTVVIGVAICPRGSSADPIQIARGDIVRRMQDAVTLQTTVPAITSIQREAATSRIRERVDAIATEMLPPSLESPGVGALDHIIPQPLIFEFTDHAYVDLNIRVQLLQTEMFLKYELMFPALTKPEQEAIRASLKPLVEGVEASMEHRLVGNYPLFTGDEIRRRVNAMDTLLSRKIEDPDSYWLKMPLPKATADALLREFDARLAQSVGRVADRIKRGASARDGSVDVKQATFLRSQILDEVISPLISLVETDTTDSARTVDISVKFAPELHKLQRDLFSMRESLLNGAAAQSSDK